MKKITVVVSTTIEYFKDIEVRDDFDVEGFDPDDCTSEAYWEIDQALQNPDTILPTFTLDEVNTVKDCNNREWYYLAAFEK